MLHTLPNSHFATPFVLLHNRISCRLPSMTFPSLIPCGSTICTRYTPLSSRLGSSSDCKSIRSSFALSLALIASGSVGSKGATKSSPAHFLADASCKRFKPMSCAFLLAIPVTKTSSRTVFSSLTRFPRLIFCVNRMMGRNIPTMAPTMIAKMAPPESLSSDVDRVFEVEELKLLCQIDGDSICDDTGTLVRMEDEGSGTPVAMILGCAPVLDEVIISANVLSSTNISRIVVPPNVAVGAARVSISRCSLGICIANRVSEQITFLVI